jgi:hypothetical protein
MPAGTGPRPAWWLPWSTGAGAMTDDRAGAHDAPGPPRCAYPRRVGREAFNTESGCTRHLIAVV